MASKPWPIQHKWRWAYALALAILVVVEVAAIWFGWQDGDWSRTLTHQTIAIVWRHPWLGILGGGFLVWLVWHFLPPFVRIWREKWGRQPTEEG